MPTIENENGQQIFEWEDSEDMDRETSCLLSNVGDFLPLPETLDVTRYLYIGFVWIPASQRRQGLAKQLISDFVKQHPLDNVYIELCKSDKKNNPLNGLVLEPSLKEIGFAVEYRLPNRIGMFLKR